jgi:hypothetical protein
LKLTSTSILPAIESIVNPEGTPMESLLVLARTIAVGVAATAVMDLWLLGLKRAGIPTLDFALLGRWTGHLMRGRFAHDAIRRAAPIPRERLLGWLTHYGVGIAFAAVPVAWQGADWLTRPALVPALAWGLATVAAPLFVMQPAMGAGIASSRTAAPLKNVLRSLSNHAVFGLGLYLGAVSLARVTA